MDPLDADRAVISPLAPASAVSGTSPACCYDAGPDALPVNKDSKREMAGIRRRWHDWLT